MAVQDKVDKASTTEERYAPRPYDVGVSSATEARRAHSPTTAIAMHDTESAVEEVVGHVPTHSMQMILQSIVEKDAASLETHAPVPSRRLILPNKADASVVDPPRRLLRSNEARMKDGVINNPSKNSSRPKARSEQKEGDGVYPRRLQRSVPPVRRCQKRKR